jgi:hypothetical protein
MTMTSDDYERGYRNGENSEYETRAAMLEPLGFDDLMDFIRAYVAQREALRALVAVEPTYTDHAYGSDAERCVFCEGSDQPGANPGDFWNFVHEPDCPWVRARARLGEEG